MKRITLWLYSGFIGLLLTSTANAQNSKAVLRPFIHPGMVQNREDLEYMKQQVLASKEPWKSAFERLKRETAAEHKPAAFTHLSQGAYGADDSGGRQLDNDAKAAYNNALVWYITGEKPYADRAIEILNTWSKTLWDFDDNNAKLLAGLTGHYLLNAAEIIRYTDSGWQKNDIHQFKKLMLTVYYPMIKDFFPEANGNWDAAMINTMLCIGVFCDDRQIFDRAVNRFYRGSGNGGITKYIYSGGQIQETSRDWGHVQLGIGEFAKAAQVAWTQKIDFYSVAGNRLALGFEYSTKYMLGGTVPAYGNISTRDMKTYRDIYESVYDHYHNLLGFDMPYTLKTIELTRPNSSAVLLTSFRKQPQKSIPAPLPLLPGSVLRNTGALSGPTVSAPANAIRVKAGESVQAALDASSGKGGWVVLAKGVHSITEPLRIPSQVTLSGEGNGSILFLSPQVRTSTIVSAGKDMHHVVLRDFLIEGATSIDEGTDPNSNRRIRANQNAPSREGVVFAADKDGQMRHIQLLHLTVQNFTKNGVSIKGATDVIIDSCNFSDNGSSVVPGPGIHHNLNLTHVSNGKITNSRFDASPWGNGIHILLSDKITITNNEAARNKLAGIRCSEVDQILVTGNLAEGNDGNGILLDALLDHSHVGLIEKNITRNNGGFGIKADLFKGAIRNNIAEDNGQ